MPEHALAKTLAALAMVDSATATPRPPEICYVSPAHADSIGNWSADPDRPPVFIVPWIDSGGEYLVDLARALGGDWPFCILVNPEPDDSAMTIESLADALLISPSYLAFGLFLPCDNLSQLLHLATQVNDYFA